MTANKLMESLARFPLCLEPLIRSLSTEDARWKPETGDWSVLEILCHLRDEEVEDFRARLKSTLENPHASWLPIDPTSAAIARQYNEESLLDVLTSFLEERQKSLAWLNGMAKPDWHLAHVHPILGTIRSGDLLASWAAHDWLHLRQISKRLYGLGVYHGQPWSADYAGDWTA